jgi:hypothetical protein
LLTVKNQIDQTSGYTHAAVFDFATFYHQVELAKPARPFYAFLFEGKTYAIRTIPTGHRHCCALAQSITGSIVELAVQEVGGWSAEGCAYFDNGRILTLNHEDAVKALEVVKSLCKTCGITMNAAESMVASEYVFLGVHYSHEPSGTWTNLTQKFVSKAVSAMLALQNPDASMRKVLHAFGLLIFSSQVLDLDMSQFYYIFKFVRRRVRTCGEDLEKPARLWASLMPVWSLWLDLVVKNTPRLAENYTRLTAEYTLWTDACHSGWGGILYEHLSGKVYVAAGPFEKKETGAHINELELRAVHLSLVEFAGVLSGCAVEIHIDNTSALSYVELFLQFRRARDQRTVGGTWNQGDRHRLRPHIGQSCRQTQQNSMETIGETISKCPTTRRRPVHLVIITGLFSGE